MRLQLNVVQENVNLWRHPYSGYLICSASEEFIAELNVRRRHMLLNLEILMELNRNPVSRELPHLRDLPFLPKASQIVLFAVLTGRV